MSFHEDYARNKVNEAIKTGLNSQKAHRILSENWDSKVPGKKTRKKPFRVNLIKRLVQMTVSFLNMF